MSELNGMDPIGLLRAANPVPADEVPDASLARVSAKVQEHIMSHEQTTNPRPVVRRRTFALVGAAALTGVLVLAVVGFGGMLPGADKPGGDNGPGGGLASCMAYDPTTLPTFEVVFDGTITAITGNQITFAVNQGWKGASGSITLTAPDTTSVSLLGEMPDFQAGGRYLVTAASGNVNGCGYTLDYEAGAAAAWAAAFAS